MPYRKPYECHRAAFVALGTRRLRVVPCLAMRLSSVLRFDTESVP